MHKPVYIAGIFRRLKRHVAIGTLRGFGRIVKRACALPGHAAGLPIVVFVEAPNPAIMVYRHIQMNLVACGTKLRSLVTHEGLQEDAAMRLRIQVDQKIVQRAHNRILARGHFVQRRILQVEIALTHGALHLGNGVAHHATQSGLGFRTVHELLDGCIHLAGIQHSGVVASATPFRGTGSDGVLHVLNALAVPLVVERRKMVHRAVPLVVDVLVAALAGI